MKNNAWPTFSFGEFLRPASGWKVDHAVLATYSADLVATVTSLLALSGCDLDGRRAANRVEVVRAVEMLIGRVRVVAQAGRVVLPTTAPPIVALLDRFLKVIKTDETESSWHPKAAFIRLTNKDSKREVIWRVWIGSRNLTRSLNWESGLVLESRGDAKGQRIPGLSDLGAELIRRAELPNLGAERVREELSRLTWECPAGVKVRAIQLFGEGLASGFPGPQPEASKVMLVSPFLDLATLDKTREWGGPGARRVLLSTPFELNRVAYENPDAFKGFDDVLWCNVPELPGQGADSRLEETPASSPETSESEELPPAGLHAKMIYAANSKERKLWMGSANATVRGWSGRNFEIVAELALGKDSAQALEQFVESCQAFTPGRMESEEDYDEEALETARKKLSLSWIPKQRVEEGNRIVYADVPPPIGDPTIKMEVSPLGGSWAEWPVQQVSLSLGSLRPFQQSDLIQVRLVRNERMCGWVQVAEFVPTIEVRRDRSVIAEYLDPEAFLLWLRSVLHDRPAAPVNGEWDSNETGKSGGRDSSGFVLESGLIPTVEEILGAWARNSDAFRDADSKVRDYLDDLEKRAIEAGKTEAAKLLSDFRKSWATLAKELANEPPNI